MFIFILSTVAIINVTITSVIESSTKCNNPVKKDFEKLVLNVNLKTIVKRNIVIIIFKIGLMFCKYDVINIEKQNPTNTANILLTFTLFFNIDAATIQKYVLDIACTSVIMIFIIIFSMTESPL
ncbi:MAG: hypothetical protein Q4D02_00220 [Clostridia bacterium]|nr:hypothetical protein [Clostridia bacterium]